MGTGADLAGERRLEHGAGIVGQQREEAAAKSGGPERDQRDEKILGNMSPFDEQEEWAKISEIMASFGTGLVRESVFVSELEKEFQARLGMNTDTDSPCALTIVGQWLSKLGLGDYESIFLNYGFDDLEFINGVLEEADLREMGISSEQDRSAILEAVGLLDDLVAKRPGDQPGRSVDDWLASIHLPGYAELFRRHLYTDMERVRRVWEIELAAVLEIQKPGHRKRILASVSGGSSGSSSACRVTAPTPAGTRARNGPVAVAVVPAAVGPNLEDLNKDLNALKTNIQQLKQEIREKMPEPAAQGSNGLATPTTSAPPTPATTSTTSSSVGTTGTLKHRKNRPAPPPPQKPPSAQNGAAHAPEQLEIRGPSELLFGVPSTLKTQWRHQPKDLVMGCVTYVANYLGSTVVKELRGTESTKKSIQKLKKVCRDPRGTPNITLSISYRGVQFLNTLTDEPICEHEIRNIHCACQDADDLTHFAYITKDHASRTHFCHVFCVPTMDQATEVILTLGQAFEVAYQIALKDKIGCHTTRSQSANQLTSIASPVSNSTNGTNAFKAPNLSSRDPSQKDHHQHRESNNHQQNNASRNSRTKTRSKSITNPFVGAGLPNSGACLSAPPPPPPVVYRIPSPNKSVGNSNSHHSNAKPVNLSSQLAGEAAAAAMKLLASHGRSHSVNEIKINGSQMKLVPVPVDDISIGVKDMKAGSRAPIALSEEL